MENIVYKENIINEMARIMYEACRRVDEHGKPDGFKCMTCEWFDKNTSECKSIYKKEAIALYEAGYRKIPKGMIVIDENEYKDKIYRLHRATQTNAMLQENVDDFKTEIDKYVDIIQKVKKDILELVLEECRYLQAEYSHYCKTKAECIKETSRYEGVLAVRNAIYKLAQKCGVEVE